MNALAKKLFIKPNTNWLVYNAPKTYLEMLDPLPDGVNMNFEAAGSVDGIQFFMSSLTELNHGLSIIKALSTPATIVWATYPKKSSGVVTDLNLDMTNNWDEVTQAGLETVAIVSIDAVWTAVRLRLIGIAKRSGVGNEQVKQNDYSAYIDVENKTVAMPTDMAEALSAEPQAMDAYQRLAYSHRKEYVLWLLTAKQQKTRDDRLIKMVAMLLDDKKNPGDKLRTR